MAKIAPKGSLTIGSPAKQLFTFALPFLISNAIGQIYALSDAAVVGRYLGAESLAAIGSVGIIGWPFAFTGGLFAGFSALLAQNIGSGDNRKIRETFYNALLWTTAIALAFGVLLLAFLRPLLVMYRVPPEILDLAQKYGNWVVLVNVLSAVTTWFILSLNASGNSRPSLFISVLAGGVNLFLDFIFIGVCGFGADTAGIASVIAQTVSLLLAMYCCKRSLPMLAISKGERVLSRSCLLALQRRSLPLGLTNLLTQTGVVVLSFCQNGLGTEYIAGSSLGIKLLNFATLPIISLGNAAAIYAAQNYGAGEYKRIRHGLNFCHVALFGWVAVCGVVLFFGGRPLLGAMVGGEQSAAVVDHAFLYLMLNIPACLILVPVTVQKFAIQALGRRMSPLFAGISEVICKIAASLLLTAAIGYLGICLSNPLSWLGAGIPIFIDYWIVTRRFRRLETAPPSSGETI